MPRELRPELRLFAAGWRRIFLGQGHPKGQAVVDRDGHKQDQADGDDRMHDQHEPMPWCRISTGTAGL